MLSGCAGLTRLTLARDRLFDVDRRIVPGVGQRSREHEVAVKHRSGGIGDRVQRGAPLPILPPLRSLLPVPGAAQSSMSAQIFFAQPSAILPSLSLRAADTPPAPGTGCTLLVAASYWYTEAIWMAFLASTKL